MSIMLAYELAFRYQDQRVLGKTKLLPNKSLYYGYTIDLRRRLKEHKENGEWELIYYEAYRSEEDARKRERKLKDYGQSRTHLKRRLSKSLLK